MVLRDRIGNDRIEKPWTQDSIRQIEDRNPKKKMNLIRGPFKLLLLQRERVRVPVPPWCENWKHVETYHKEAINLSNNATNYFYQQFKNIRQTFWKTPFVSTPFRDQNSIQQFDEIFEARRFRGLTHSRYNFKWDRGAASQIWFWDPCFGEKIC
jgi:hypothetical protein